MDLINLTPIKRRVNNREEDRPFSWWMYVGLFMISAATLMQEVVLTRIFSVTMWYHYAFMAVSIALFGMTVGAMIVYLYPSYFSQERAKHHLALFSQYFSISIILSFLTQLSIPFIPFKSAAAVFVIHNSIIGLYATIFLWSVISIPFLFSGICITIVLTKFPRYVNKLYAFDLMGAGAGAFGLLLLLEVMDAPTAVVAIAFIANVGALFFTFELKSNNLVYKKVIFASVLAIILIINFVSVSINSPKQFQKTASDINLLVNNFPYIRLTWVKESLDGIHVYEKWNSFSRIVVDRAKPYIPKGSSRISSAYSSDKSFDRLMITIDSVAATPIFKFLNNIKEFDFFKYSIADIAHQLRPSSDVLVIGSGGGQDILSALYFDQKSVTGVEINEDVMGALAAFGEFAGHIEKNPKVMFVNDEARSFIARSEKQYDIMMIASIDSWAATAAGAFALTENSLYTVEAWETFLEHLTDRGVLTVTRRHFVKSPGEIYRMTSIARTALEKLGIDNPKDHIIVISNLVEDGKINEIGWGNIIVSKKPFSGEDIAKLGKIISQMNFIPTLVVGKSDDEILGKIINTDDLYTFANSYPVNIAPSTDDNPFFFHMLRFRDVFNKTLFDSDRFGIIDQGSNAFNMQAVSVLVLLFIIILFLSFIAIILPLLLRIKQVPIRQAWPLFVFFASIGFGFMLIEISQMQRLMIFLGHPTYALSVVLFSLLLAGGIGSYISGKIGGSIKEKILIFAVLLLIVIIFGFATLPLIRMFEAYSIFVRVLVAIAVLTPLGVCMGMPFPLGMKTASISYPRLTPWFWGINGATSVTSSILAVFLALFWGISSSYWLGLFFYIVASLSLVFFILKPRSHIPT